MLAAAKGLAMTAIDLLGQPETLAELAEIPNVAAVKQATSDPGQARRILAETDLALYAGNDDLLLPFLELGAVGGILVYTHVVGPQVRELVTRFRDGDVEGALGHVP